MAEYIDRDALIAFLNEDMVFCKHALDESPFSKGVQTGLNAGINYATVLAAADVVEVVRCKECKFSELEFFADNGTIRTEMYKCLHPLYGIKVLEHDDYCSKGERRADDG